MYNTCADGMSTREVARWVGSANETSKEMSTATGKNL